MGDARDFDKLPVQDLENLIQSGIDSEFWKWFVHVNKKAQDGNSGILGEAEAMHRLRVSSWDDVVKLIQLNAIYKTREEILGFPQMVLKTMEIQKKVNERSTPTSD